MYQAHRASLAQPIKFSLFSKQRTCSGPTATRLTPPKAPNRRLTTASWSLCRNGSPATNRPRWLSEAASSSAPAGACCSPALSAWAGMQDLQGNG